MSGFALGFGIVEQNVERDEGERVNEFLRSRFSAETDPWFTQEIVDELSIRLAERKLELDELDKKYKDATDYPERYSTFSYRVLTNGSDLVVVFRFSHINRRHPMSPDGWALLQTTYPHYVYYQDVAEIGGARNGK